MSCIGRVSCERKHENIFGVVHDFQHIFSRMGPFGIQYVDSMGGRFWRLEAPFRVEQFDCVQFGQHEIHVLVFCCVHEHEHFCESAFFEALGQDANILGHDGVFQFLL